MPLYNLKKSDLPRYLSWFNRHAQEGKLTFHVIKGILEQRGHKPTDAQLTTLINSLSLDTSGINRQAFIDYVSAYHELRNPDTEYAAAFRIYDVSGEGRLSKADVTAMFEQMGAKIDVDKLFEEADVDQNGYIDYDEFVGLMKR